MRKLFITSFTFLIVCSASGQDQKTLLDYQTDGDQRMVAFEFKIAIDDFNKAISLSPNDANLYLRRGICKENLQYYDEAIKDFSKAISFSPNPDYYNYRANVEFILKQYPQAINDYNKALENEETGTVNAISYYQRGMAKYYTKDKDGACADFAKSYVADNTYNKTMDALTNYCGGLPEGSTPESNALVSSSENPEIKSAIGSLIEKGQEKEAAGDMKDAEEDFTKAINLDVNNAKTWWERGKFREKSGNPPGAIDDFTKSLNLVPDVKVFKDKAETEYNSGNYKAAVNDYTQALSYHNNLENFLYYSRGLAEYKSGDQAAGCQDMQMAKKENYPGADAALNTYCGSEDNDDNVPTLANAAREELNRGIYYWLIEDYDNARIEFTRSIQLNPASSDAWFCRAKIWFTLGQKDNACLDLNQAMVLGEPDALGFIKKYCGGE